MTRYGVAFMQKAQVEGGVLELGEGRGVHDRGVADDDIHAPKRLLVGLEQGADGDRIGDVGLTGDGASAGRLDVAHDLGRKVGVCQIVDGHGEPVAREPFCGGGADPARGSGDDGGPPRSGLGLGACFGRSLGSGAAGDG